MTEEKDNIGKKAVKGVSWSMIETGSIYFIRFFLGIVLARILTPADFGLIGIILIFVSISDVLVNAGFGQAFIQKQNTTNVDADTVFYINIFIAFIIYGILFLFSPVIAVFFKQPLLVKLIRVLSLIIIVNSLNVIQLSIIRKELLFKKKAVITVIASVISGIVGVLCAHVGYGVWSLVIQQLLGKSLLCIMLFKASSWKPSLSFSCQSARSLFTFGSWMLLANIFLTVFNNFYRFVIGRIFNASELGYYERARQFENLVTQTATTVFGIVAFPVFSKLQNDREQLKNTVFNFILYSSAVVYPLLICIIVVARPLILLLLTDKWLPVVPYMQLLCLVGFTVPVQFFIGPLLQAVKYAKIAFYYTLVLGGIRILNVSITCQWGVSGIILGELVTIILTTIIMSKMMLSLLDFDYIRSVLRLHWVLPLSLLSGLFGWLVLLSVDYSPLWVQVFLPTLIILCVYVIGLFSLDYQFSRYRGVFAKHIVSFINGTK
jgi:O-antigen/teichoic acid export membrane protein